MGRSADADLFHKQPDERTDEPDLKERLLEVEGVAAHVTASITITVASRATCFWTVLRECVLCEQLRMAARICLCRTLQVRKRPAILGGRAQVHRRGTLGGAQSGGARSEAIPLLSFYLSDWLKQEAYLETKLLSFEPTYHAVFELIE
jgi:hypothetical protein